MDVRPPTLERALAAGHQHLRDESFGAAAAAFERALEALESTGGEDAALRVELLAALAEARIECDRLAAAGQALDEAQRLSGVLATRGAAVAPGVAASLLLGRARVHVWKRELESAEPLLHEALALLGDPSAGAGGAPGAMAQAAACHATLAAVLSQTGALDAAIPEYRAAWALLDTPALRHLGKERSRVQMNFGNARWAMGDARDACRHYEAALEVLYGLVDAGCEARRTDIARICRNLGGALTSLDDFAGAEAAFGRALELYALEIRREQRAKANTARLRASRAATRMNLGYTFYRVGRFDEAAAQYALSLRDYRALGEAAPQLHDDEARTWVNQAHLLHRQGRPAAAQRAYARAMRRFAEMAAQGKPHLRADEANAQLGLARALAAQGRPAAALRHGEAALARLAALSHAGQLYQARAWLQGLRGLADALREHGAGRGGSAAFAVLAGLLARPPQRGHPVAAEQLDELGGALDALDTWRTADAPPALAGFADAWLRHVLDWIARLLGESDPAWLQQHAALLQACVARAGEAAARTGDALLRADWFLATRGLRAQRNALAHSADARVQELAALLRRLHQLEEELLGQPHDPAIGTPGTLGSAPRLAPAADADARVAEWNELHRRGEALREQAVHDGLLPQRLQLGAATLAQALAPRSGLVLLCRPADDRIVLIALVQAGSHGPAAEAAELPLPAELAAFRCDQLVALVRHSIVGAARGRGLRRAAAALPPRPDAPGVPAGADLAAFAAAMLDRLAAGLAAPIDAWRRAFDWQDWALVPSDDLHFVPWSQLRGGGAVYPSVGAWLRHACRAPVPAPQGTRWACAAFGDDAAGDVAGDALRWVEVERALCERLWHEAGTPPVCIDAARRSADGIDAFVGMGHGGAPQHNLARAGLALDGGAVLTAHDLPALHTCRRVVLSCCVLGQTQEAFGEPLGFLSAAFGYDAGFGSGWLTEVPDAEAGLFGVAFQFALQRAGAHDWNEVFEVTRRAIAAGRWPEGFGAWLREAWPAVRVEAPAAWCDAPPESLRRLMPWAVCLGR